MRILIGILLIGTVASGTFFFLVAIACLIGQNWISKKDMEKVDELIKKHKKKECEVWLKQY